jgi:hypothetical protein
MTLITFSFALITALFLIKGLFLFFDIKLADVSTVLFVSLTRKQRRRRKIRQLAGKRPALVSRKLAEARQMLLSSGMGEQVRTYSWLSLVLGLSGLIFGLLLDNIAAALVLALGLALAPLIIIRIRTAEYLRGLNANLETGLGLVTNSYIQSADIIVSIRDNLHLIPAPLDQLLANFLVETQLIDANLVRALQILRSKINNRHWQDWCSVLIQCQHDRQLRYSLPGIVERLGETRRIQLETDTIIQKHFGDYLITVLIVLGSIPLMGFMMNDWYEMLLGSVPGKITLALVLGAILFTALWVAGIYQPLEHEKAGDIRC